MKTISKLRLKNDKNSSQTKNNQNKGEFFCLSAMKPHGYEPGLKNNRGTKLLIGIYRKKYEKATNMSMLDVHRGLSMLDAERDLSMLDAGRQLSMLDAGMQLSVLDTVT